MPILMVILQVLIFYSVLSRCFPQCFGRSSDQIMNIKSRNVKRNIRLRRRSHEEIRLMRISKPRWN